MRAADMLAGGYSIGDRIQGPRALGTVTGPPTRVALKAVAVKVLWDDGNVSDERATSLSSLSPSSRSKPSKPKASGGYPAHALVNGRGLAPTTGLRSDHSKKALSPPATQGRRVASPASSPSCTARPGSSTRVPSPGASAQVTSPGSSTRVPSPSTSPRVPSPTSSSRPLGPSSSHPLNAFSYAAGGSSASGPGNRRISPASAITRGRSGAVCGSAAGMQTAAAAASCGCASAVVAATVATAPAASRTAGRPEEVNEAVLLPGGWRPGDEVLSNRGALGTVAGPSSRLSLRAVAVSVNWGRGYGRGNATDERVSNLRLANPSPPATPPSQTREAQVSSRGMLDQPLRHSRRSLGHGPTSQGSPQQSRGEQHRGERARSEHPRGERRGEQLLKGELHRGEWDRNDLPRDAQMHRGEHRSDHRGGGEPPPPPSDALLPVVSRPTKRRSTLDGDVDGLGSPNPIDMLRRHSVRMGYRDAPMEAAAPRPRFDSCVGFADRMQTVIVFDWDDTLFPTSWILDDAGLDWTLPLSKQRSVRGYRRDAIAEKLALCEDHAVGILQRAHQCGHVVIVTLAAAGWVEKACRQFYRRVGDLLVNLKISVVYAQGPHTKRDLVMQKAKGVTDEEFWGLLKGRAISEEVAKFYSRYEGQTWKNVLSIGDSRFERYGLLAATTAYMQSQDLNDWNRQPYSPTQQNVWEKVNEDAKVVHLRAKCVKLVDRPDVEELTIELNMVSRWLMSMVRLDEGFDLDLDNIRTEQQVSLVEAVMLGTQPVSTLP